VANRPHSDKLLGLNEPISRRDFLDGMLLASSVIAVGAAFLPFGPGRGDGSPEFFYGITPGSQSTPGPGPYLAKG
jgi:hypothetical protein